MKQEHSKLKRLRPLRRFLRRGTFFDLRRSKRFITATLRCFGVACSYRTPGRGCRLSYSHSLSCSLCKTRALLLGAISFAQASPFLIFSLVGGGVADRVDKRRLLLVTQSLQNWLRVYLGDPDCNGSRTVLVYRCIVGARRNHA